MPTPHTPWPQSSWGHRGLGALLLWPLSLLYGTLAAMRRGLYRHGWLRSVRLRVPTVVVGNVVAGGGGKTPVVIALVQHLQTRGWHPGVVSRGYGRSSSGTLLLNPGSQPRDVGDEPLLIAQRTGAPVAVARRRSDAAHALLARHPEIDIIVCDDGLQHLALARDIEICVFGAQGVGNGWQLPAGPLREPWPRPVDFVLHAGSAPPPSGTAPMYPLARRLAPLARDAHGQQVALADLVGRPLLALAGTAHPQDFFAMLSERGLAPNQCLALPDHYNFDSLKFNTNKRWQLIFTEKDAVKLWARCPDGLAVALDPGMDPAFFAALDARLASLSSGS